MKKFKFFTQKEKEAIETVLNMSFTIQNSNEDLLKSDFGEYIIVKSDWSEKGYKSISSALTQFCKREEDYANGF